ncbi:MAG: hypothetical protein J2P43_01895 [Candidatus Dormibacteraeota bacterium]|nr:hypothetical protein [Candidatus Dormibacteraeota bacterium]
MRRWLPRAAVAVILLALAALSYPGADLAAWAIRPDDALPQRAPAGTLPWLHVAHPPGGLPFIADPLGRQVILRGAVVAGLVDWWSGSDPNQADPPRTFRSTRPRTSVAARRTAT